MPAEKAQENAEHERGNFVFRAFPVLDVNGEMLCLTWFYVGIRVRVGNGVLRSCVVGVHRRRQGIRCLRLRLWVIGLAGLLNTRLGICLLHIRLGLLGAGGCVKLRLLRLGLICTSGLACRAECVSALQGTIGIADVSRATTSTLEEIWIEGKVFPAAMRAF